MTSFAGEPAKLAKSMKRCNKPMMERRRRERINKSLDDLKSLVIQASNKNSSQFNKLEKADILEMTVKHLRCLQQQRVSTEAAKDPGVMDRFGTGFQECAGEVSRYLGTVENLSPEVHSRLLNHLGACASQISVPSGNQHSVPMATQMTTLPGNGPEMTRDYHVMTMQSQTHVTPVSKTNIPEIGLVQAQIYYVPNIIVGHPGNGIHVSPSIGSPDSGIGSPEHLSPVCSRTSSPVQTSVGNVMTAGSSMHVAPPTSHLVMAGPSKVWRPW